MRKWTGRLLATLAVLALAACGSNGGVPANRDLLLGTWLLVQNSTDGGQTFTDATTTFTFTLQDNGLWTDSEGQAGLWSVSGDRFTTKHADSSFPDEHSLYSLERSNQDLRFRYTNDSFTPTNRVSIYTRQN